MRREQEIFNDLAKLCSSPGYAHVIAYLCFRDNVVRYSGEMTAEDMQHQFSGKQLIRTEISTLIGLLIKEAIDYTLPAAAVVQENIEKTEALLEEMHQSMSAAMMAGLDPKKIAETGVSHFTSGEALREAIFYGGESAYGFQFRDLAPRKYASDDEWLVANKGFPIRAARDVVLAIGNLQDEKVSATLKALRRTPPDKWTLLPGFTFTVPEIAARTGMDRALVVRVLDAFTVPAGKRNENFRELHDFNIANAWPLLRDGDDTFILFQRYGLFEALYDAPFYWMNGDRHYVADAMRHRGRFTEEFARDRLEHVFGKDNVYSNVDIFESKDKKIGEIDVLVIFGNRAIVLQAKSKRLTLEARRGNDGQIKDDFKKSIQDSYDQGLRCAKLLSDAKYTLAVGDSKKIAAPTHFKEIYILCVVSDHYPALSLQARQFLNFETTNAIQPPFVMDVFTLDAMTEMLASPLFLLSYVNRRTNYFDRVSASHELTILSYHLKTNLWLDDKHDMVMLHDDISTDLDVAMLVRRDGVPGNRTPDGILTRLAATALGRIVEEIEARPDPATIDLGFMLLSLSEQTVVDISKGIDMIAARATQDRKSHDLTVGIGRAGTGLTIHCSHEPSFIAGPSLQRHCKMRKYTEHADIWFGLCIRPKDASVRFGLNLDYKWEKSPEMDAATKDLPRPGKLADLPAKTQRKRKVGRNEPCPCGSGKKYKKCCLVR